MEQLRRTAFFDRHRALGAKMVGFGGWEMPIQYPTGVVQEHLATRRHAGLFDVSHMGRFLIRGRHRLSFLQHVLTNNAEALDGRPTGAQYTVIPDPEGGAVDDAYLYRFSDDEHLLVVNAANREKDRDHLRAYLDRFGGVELIDATEDLVMLALQGPASRDLLSAVVGQDRLPEPVRNAVATIRLQGATAWVGRTGYTGEPVGFELFLPPGPGLAVWDRLVELGATPCGLGARDTLRLEAGFPLYGHELGTDPEGRDIPILAVPLTRVAVSLAPGKGDSVGRLALERQFDASSRIMRRDFSDRSALPRMVRPVAVRDRGIARQGDRVFRHGRHVGYVTSGTRIPYWEFEGPWEGAAPGEASGMRSICLALVDSDLLDQDPVTIDVRGKRLDAVIVPFHLRSEAPPYARPIVVSHEEAAPAPTRETATEEARRLLERAARNTEWRQEECINLIPSEMTASPLVRLLSVMDPAFRYAEHRSLEAFYETEVFYYQGTGFIGDVERRVEAEMASFLGCPEVEARVVSGQMANAAVFSGMVDYVNRTDRRAEPRRLRRVLNHHIGKGGHLSAQPMGALRDFVARDPATERPAVVNFPVLPEDPYRVDVPATLELIEATRPELIVFGKSVILAREPVAQVRAFLEARGIDAVVMYDMAHVLGLVGPHFQQPFEEGADLVTGSTHKTFFGTQRGVIGGRFREQDERYELWEAIRSRTFPGSVSNHHLGTLLGLLLAVHEMRAFKDEYQPKVIANAKAFARALHDRGLNVAGDPDVDFTETHQVVVDVGYGRGPAMAVRLEENGIICNYQARPQDEGFTAAGGLRLGVAEMTRFGMEPEDFRELAALMHEVIARDATVVDRVRELRKRFRELRYCFRPEDFPELTQRLVALLA